MEFGHTSAHGNSEAPQFGSTRLLHTSVMSGRELELPSRV